MKNISVLSLIFLSIAPHQCITMEGSPEKSLMAAIAANDSVKVTEALDKGANINVQCTFDEIEIYNTTPLRTAICKQHVPIVKLLLQRGANPSFVNKTTPISNHLWSPLGQALQIKDATTRNNIITSLVEAGANPAECDEDGATPLHFIAEWGYKTRTEQLSMVPIIELFINKGARVEQGDKWGTTPLHKAVISNNQSIACALMRHPMTFINASDKSGFTALHYAVMEANKRIDKEFPDMVEFLLSAGADPEKQSDKGFKPHELTHNPWLKKFAQGHNNKHLWHKAQRKQENASL